MLPDKISSIPIIVLSILLTTFLLAHDIENEPPTWTHYLKGGMAVTVSSGALGYYRIKRVHENTFNDMRILGYFIGNETLAIIRYKSSNKFDKFPKFYKFTITSLRHSTESDLKIRYHFNQGLGAFLFQYPTTHLTMELALSYDMSDYLNDTRKTSYLKGGLFWDVDLGKSSLSLDLEYFNQISDNPLGENDLSRYEVSAEFNTTISKGYIVTIGYENEFFLSADIRNVRSFYFAVGFKRLLPIKI